MIEILSMRVEIYRDQTHIVTTWIGHDNKDKRPKTRRIFRLNDANKPDWHFMSHIGDEPGITISKPLNAQLDRTVEWFKSEGTAEYFPFDWESQTGG